MASAHSKSCIVIAIIEAVKTEWRETRCKEVKYTSFSWFAVEEWFLGFDHEALFSEVSVPKSTIL